MEQLTRAILSFLSMIRIVDLIDIAVVSYFVYKLIGVARKSSVGRLLKGLLVLLAIMAFANMFQLYALSWLIDRAVEWGVLALVVLFQPEIRSFLETMGNSRWNGMFSFARGNDSNTMEKVITEAVSTYASFSKDKVGALIVFERKNLLDDVIRTGTALDASVSGELLKNIFWNKAPLHDGAVIVRNGRIVGAGCMLPMSGNVNLSRDLGMRHRAGIGISEHSDAVVAIVSEETGSISVAVGGMLKRHLAPETLERLLRNELLSTEPKSKAKGEMVSFAPLFSALSGRFRKEDQKDG